MENTKALELVAQTSEQRFGICTQPSDTCPTLDALYNKCFEVEKDITRLQRGLFKGDASEVLKDVDSELDSVLRTLSDYERDINLARKNCEAIREWGRQWKVLAKNQSANISYLEDQLAEAQAQLSAMREDLDMFTSWALATPEGLPKHTSKTEMARLKKIADSMVDACIRYAVAPKHLRTEQAMAARQTNKGSE